MNWIHAATPSSRRVKKIIKLEARANKLQGRYKTIRARLLALDRQAESLQILARSIESHLTGSQLGELKRARKEREEMQTWHMIKSE